MGPGNILRLLPGLLQKAPLAVYDTTSLAHAGMLLMFRQLDFLPVHLHEVLPSGRLRRAVGGLGGMNVVRALSEFRSAELLRKTVQDVCNPEVGTVGPASSLAEILGKMAETRFGHVAVSGDGELLATVALRDLVQYAPTVGLDGDLAAGEVASPAIGIPHDATFSDALDLLARRGVRRALVTGLPQPRMVDDRSIVQYAFSYEGLRTLQAAPERFYRRPVYSLPLLRPGEAHESTCLADAWPLLYANPAECLLVGGGSKVLTPWDVVMKPYLAARSLVPAARPAARAPRPQD